MQQMWKIGRWVVLGAIVASVVYWTQFAPVAVVAVVPVRQTVTAEVMGTGTLEARVSSTISPKISGRIGRVLVDQGDRVDANQLIVQLDDEELKQQVAIAEANRDAAQAAVVRIQADKDRAIAVFEQAERHYARVKALSEKNASTSEDLERATETLAIATADMSRAEAAIAEGQKSLIAAAKTSEYHRARLADTTISAPFSGLIVERHKEVGDIAIPGSAILTLISTDMLWVSAWVDETEMSKLAIQQPARVVFRSQPDLQYPGTVSRLGQQADRETREFIVEVQVPEMPAQWAVGQRAEVFIETARKQDAITIPLSTIIRREQDEGVFVNSNGIAQWRPLKLGLRGRDAIEILDGLSESEIVIRSPTGVAPLVEGRRVKTP